MEQEQVEAFTDEQHEVLQSIRVTRIIFPILLGLGVVLYLLYGQFDPEEFAKINWTVHTLLWIGVSVLVLVIRHLAYAVRLRILSEGKFSWLKCIELIFIWEFSSAVSPTSVGGSAVALFILAQEKLSTAKVTTIVLYSAVLDTIFFIGTIPILLAIFGWGIIRPGINSLSDIDGWGFTFFGAYTFMAIYGSLFFYGLFINPKQIKHILVGFTRIRWLHRFRARAIQLGDDIIVASREIWRKKWPFHLSAFLATAIAWSSRFILINFLIIGIVNTVPLDFFNQAKLYARLETMFVIMAFSPTPGGAGFAEIVFGGFLKDYVPPGISLIIAFIWRLLTYYTYLIAGTIIIPNWIRKILIERKRKRLRESGPIE